MREKDAMTDPYTAVKEHQTLGHRYGRLARDFLAAGLHGAGDLAVRLESSLRCL